MKILKIVLNGAGGDESVRLLHLHPTPLTSRSAFSQFSPALYFFRTCPSLVVGGACFCKLRIKFMYTFLKCVGDWFQLRIHVCACQGVGVGFGFSSGKF